MAESIQQSAAFERHPEAFEISDTLIETIHQCVEVEELNLLDNALSTVKSAILIRAFNIYKSINLLLKYDHWEEAAIISRSLFELLLNLEEILRKEKYSNQNAIFFLKFNELQKALHLINEVEYEIATDRASDEKKEYCKKLKQLIKDEFQEFYNKKKKNWQWTWCNKSARALSSASSNPLRTTHYKIIYSQFSDICHSSPYAVMTTHTESDPKDIDKFIKERNDYERKNLFEVLVLSSSWLIEILISVQAVIPSFEAQVCVDISNKINKLMGIE